MKKLLVLLLPAALCATAAFGLEDERSNVRWNSVVGVITAPGADNPVGTIHGGAGSWSARSGRAQVNLSNGITTFNVDGLVLNGGASSGTPGAISAVRGTLVCYTVGTAQTILDTTPVPLNVRGDAHFTGQVAGIPVSFDNPLFLIRIDSPAGAAGR